MLTQISNLTMELPLTSLYARTSLGDLDAENSSSSESTTKLLDTRDALRPLAVLLPATKNEKKKTVQRQPNPFICSSTNACHINSVKYQKNRLSRVPGENWGTGREGGRLWIFFSCYRVTQFTWRWLNQKIGGR